MQDETIAILSDLYERYDEIDQDTLKIAVRDAVMRFCTHYGISKTKFYHSGGEHAVGEWARLILHGNQQSDLKPKILAKIIAGVESDWIHERSKMHGARRHAHRTSPEEYYIVSLENSVAYVNARYRDTDIRFRHRLYNSKKPARAKQQFVALKEAGHVPLRPEGESMRDYDQRIEFHKMVKHAELGNEYEQLARNELDFIRDALDMPKREFATAIRLDYDFYRLSYEEQKVGINAIYPQVARWLDRVGRWV